MLINKITNILVNFLLFLDLFFLLTLGPLLYTSGIRYYNHCDPSVLLYHQWADAGLWYLHPPSITQSFSSSSSFLVAYQYGKHQPKPHTNLFFSISCIQILAQHLKPVCLHSNLNIRFIPQNHLLRKSDEESGGTPMSFFLDFMVPLGVSFFYSRSIFFFMHAS